MKSKQEGLEGAIDWFVEAKSDRIKAVAATQQQHTISLLASIMRVAKVLNIPFHEALLVTYEGRNNGKGK